MDQDPNHQRKVFIGGLAPVTTSESLKNYFSSFGPISDSIVMMDSQTRRSRGFGFVTFESPAEVETVMKQLPHIIDGKSTDTKRIVPRSERANKTQNDQSSGPLQTNKIFVGGLKGNLGESEMRTYFEQFGAVAKVDMFTDPNTGKMKGFCFVTFDSSDPVDTCYAKCTSSFDGKTEINGVRVEVKKAKVPDKSNRTGPQGGRFNFQGNMGGQNMNQGFNQGFNQGGFQQGYQQGGFQQGGGMGMQGQMGMPQGQMGMIQGQMGPSQGQMGMPQGQMGMAQNQMAMPQGQMGMQPQQNQMAMQPAQMGMMQQGAMIPQAGVVQQQPAIPVTAGYQPVQQGYAQQPQQYSQAQPQQYATAPQPQQAAVAQTPAVVPMQQFGQQATAGYGNGTAYAGGDQQWSNTNSAAQDGYDQSAQFGAIKSGASGGYNSARQQAAPYQAGGYKR